MFVHWKVVTNAFFYLLEPEHKHLNLGISVWVSSYSIGIYKLPLWSLEM